ncbi:hypothetical protein [Thalassospira xiamenensis]|uniref:hypothetical protein n=1 Tax=Thalassospira xiamenensis TaxID=220697 RepID=UPI000DEDBF1B|nr:hypothetical protein [Thalassospira xiamenensis]RCK41830.1 hypothetical protein TH24_05445 [Thalassospira xiamenensis]
MSNFSLPYPGYSWQFSQHEIGFEASTIYKMLSAAQLCEGQNSVGDSINALLNSSGVLTENIRNGKSDAWRDYQQILAELGLIVSTRLSPILQVTELGKQFLAGGLGFSELMGHQLLRYQYPNGQKTLVSSQLRAGLSEKNSRVPNDLSLIQSHNGVLIRPAALILRVLMELDAHGQDASLDIEEILEFLLPVPTNNLWEQVVRSLVQARRRYGYWKSKHQHARRNIRAWMKCLALTDLFDLQNGRLVPSFFLLQDKSRWQEIVVYLENPTGLWIPRKFDQEEKKKWFNEFGSIDQNLCDLLLVLHPGNEYLKSNYVAGVDSDDLSPLIRNDLQGINLSELSERQLPDFSSSKSEIELLRAFETGALRRHVSHRQHELMVARLGNYYRSLGCSVLEDQRSVDLFVRFPSQQECIFEVKAVSPRSLSKQLRSAVGQLTEYQYRLMASRGQSFPTSDMVVVVNMDFAADSWRVPYLTNFMGLGLMTLTSKASCFTPNHMSRPWTFI